MSFHLRPVADNSPSPSQTASMTSPPRTSPPKTVLLPSPPATNPTNGRSRRPLSPSCLRDVDLNPDIPVRKYAAPLTGHDLMALFPPAPPDNFPEMRAGPTSGYFQRQERAFFAQAGKEIVRVRLEVDLQNDPENSPQKPRARDAHPPYPPIGHIPHHSPHSSTSSSSSAAPVLYPHPPAARPPPPRGPVTASSTPVYPMPSRQPPPHQAPALRTSPHEVAQPGVAKPEYQPEEYDDEAWRRPMPYAERRRAGKHTRRVIVRT